MKSTTAKSRLRRELRRLFRSMDFVSRHPALEKEGAEPGQAPPRAGFPWELSRAQLKRFPVLLESDEDGQFAGVTIFKPTRGKSESAAGKPPLPVRRRAGAR